MSSCSDRTLLSTLDGSDAVEVTALAAELDVHPLTVAQTCHELQSRGYVRQISPDVYEITDDGRTRLSELPDQTA